MFGKLVNLEFITFRAIYFKKLIHSQGIEWIRSINHNVRGNRTDDIKYDKIKAPLFDIIIKFDLGWDMDDVIPDSDFCLWKDFPFEQFIKIRMKYYGRKTFTRKTCLWFWLDKKNDSQEARSRYPTCNYESFLKLCNKNQSQVASRVWNLRDTKLVSKSIQILLIIVSKPLYIFGIVTNSILIYVIWGKRTRDEFKEQKQYAYLGVISIVNILILSIKLLSWISDCKDTLDLFCPNTRRLLFIQFFKVCHIF